PRRRPCGRHHDRPSRAGAERDRGRHLHHADAQLAEHRRLSVSRPGDGDGPLSERCAACPEGDRRARETATLKLERPLTGAVRREQHACIVTSNVAPRLAGVLVIAAALSLGVADDAIAKRSKLRHELDLLKARLAELESRLQFQTRQLETMLPTVI